MKQLPTIKRFFTKTTLSIFILSQVVGIFAFAQPADALFGVGDWVYDPAAYLQRREMQTTDKIEATVSESMLSAVMGSLLHATSYFTRKLAYDTATYVAYGGKGQGALAFQDGPGAYFEKVALDTAADAIGELGKPFGLNLCQIPDVRLNAYLQVGLSQLYGFGSEGVQPNCRWQDLRNGGIFDGDAWKQRYGTEEGLAETFSTTLSINNTDFGVALGAIGAINNQQTRAEASARQERSEGDGFKSVTSLISGDIKTPAQIVKEETTALTAKHQGELSAGQIAGIYGSGLKQVPAMAASVFLNTLTGTLLNRLLTEGLFPVQNQSENATRASFSFFGVENGTKEEGRNAFNFLFTAKPEPLSNYPIVAEFAACPESPGLSNCVIDADMQQLIAQAKTGDPMTIREALDQGKLHGEWPLISPRHQMHSAEPSVCQNQAYCYSNIQKMRKVRILPLGFEIAALRSDPERPWTLRDVVDGFNDCARDPNDPTQVIADRDHPFCQLINPNWIIALPDVRCDANVYGPQLIASDSAIRRKECVDTATCIQKDELGNCLSYGYCTKEKNVWDIDADSCPAEFNTCDTYVNNTSGKVVSYLSRTVDFGQCTEDNEGCRAYSLEKFEDDSWRPSTIEDRSLYKAVGRNEEIYFNGKISAYSSVCDANSDGCRAYIPAQRYTNGLYVKNDADTFVQDIDANVLTLKRAPDYLGCYDTNRLIGSPGIDWPTTLQEVENLVSQDDRCDAYASVCIEEEVGCAAYEPVDGGAMIPGIIGERNVCDATCNGYDTFKQIGYKEIGQGFESEQFPLYFVPNNAMATMQANGQTCSAEYVGCDEFTNLDTVAAGGEGLEYYSSISYCEKPEIDGSNSKVFYSWEGSAREGFVLRTHRVKPIDNRDIDYIMDTLGNNANGSYVPGAPMYADDSRNALIDAAETCNEQTYNLKITDPADASAAPGDCHALYDEQGNVSYRIITNLVFVSDSCHALRKTTPHIFEDDTIGAATCTDGRGEWDANAGTCTRCVNGGEYRNGACIYWTISEPGYSESCPAAANQCRAYAGNTAGNTVNIFTHVFEPSSDDADALIEAKEGWSGYEQGHSVRVVSEATDVGLNSLLLEQGSAVVSLSATNTPGLTGNSFYEFSLWARGSGALDIRIMQGDQTLGQFDAVSVGNAWNRYRVGPVEIGSIDTTRPVQIVMTQRDGQARQVFIDTLVFTRVQDLVYLIKGSWKTAEGYDAPLVCDANPQDALPGAALGCRAYQETNTKGLVRYATGFEQLCREKAVGCTPVWDTYNTVSGVLPENAHVYNLWCAGAEGATCELVQDNVSFGSCIVPRGETGCYATQNDSLDIALPDGMGYNDLPAGWIVDATVYVPADTASDSPQFLANKEEHQCRSTQLGCEVLGLEEQFVPDELAYFSFEHQETKIKNDPAIYNDVLCNDSLVGCGSFSNEGSTYYFKDPTISGNRICSYREQQGSGEPFGWFYADPSVGRCTGITKNLCTSDDECFGENSVCANQGNIACYPNYIERGGKQGLYSNGNNSYEGFFGTCAAQYNGCTELIDHADTSNVNPDGTPYYVLFNERLESHLDECTSVGLTEGCVLFDQTDNPNKIYNTAATYELSENQAIPYSLVSPVTTATNGNESTIDANLVLKVRRDRECSEWLACRTSVPVTVPGTGQTTYACYQYQACDELGENGSACGSWVSDTGSPEDEKRALSRLGYDEYVTRGVSWYDEEFSGYSLYNRYQITNMIYLGFTFPEDREEIGNVTFHDQARKTYIARELQVGAFGAEEDVDAFDCIDPNAEDTDWQVCGFDAGGRCYNNRCLYPIDGTFTTVVPDAPNDPNERGNAIKSLVNELDTNSCKAYPEENAPFPFEVVAGLALNNNWHGIKSRDEEPFLRNGNAARRIVTDKPVGFESVNVCMDGNCSCSYNKYSYQNGIIDYWPLSSVDVENRYEAATDDKGVCVGGVYDGHICRTDLDCRTADADPNDGNFGSCTKRKQTDTKIGIEGFCLEYDYSRPLGYGDPGYACLTWLPIQTSASRVDIYNTDIEAGYYPSQDAEGYGQLYCIASTNANQSPSSFSDEVRDRYDDYFIADTGQPEVFYIGGAGRTCPAQLEDSIYRTYGRYAVLMCGTADGRDIGREVGGIGEAGQNDNCTDWFNDLEKELEDAPEQCRSQDENGQNEFYYIREDRCFALYNQANGRPEDDEEAAPFFEDGTRCFGLEDQFNNQANDANRNQLLQDFEGLTKAEQIAVLVEEWFRNRNNGEQNAVVLRAEAPDFNGSVSVTENDNYLEASSYATRLVPYHLLAPGHTPSERKGQISLGILRHPPRVFDQIDINVESERNEDNRYIMIGQTYQAQQSIPALSQYHYEQPAKDVADNSRRLFTAALSPGNKLAAQINNNQQSRVVEQGSLYRSSYESFVRENDINKLYFITTKITAGLDGQFLPPLFHDDLFIDFNKLSTLDTPAIIQQQTNRQSHTGGVYRTGFCEKTGGPSNANEEFPRFVNEAGHGGCEGGRKGVVALDSAIKWTYRLDAATTGIGDDRTGIDNPEGNLAFYESAGMNNTAEQELKDFSQRNQVARRYVLVYMGDSDASRIDYGRVLPFDMNQISNNNGIPDLGNATQNPFHADACDIQDDANMGAGRKFNWFAIGLDFNAEGEFLGYISRNCNIDNRAAAPQLAVVATLNDQCTEFAEVYQEPDEGVLQGDSNKAWTERLWTGVGHSLNGIFKNAVNTPFGSLQLESGALDMIDENDQKANRDILRNYTFRYADDAAGSPQYGVPLSCTTQLYGMAYTNSRGLGENLRCQAYLERFGDLVSRQVVSQQGRDQAVNNLSSLFAKTYSRFRFITDREINYRDNNYQFARLETDIDLAGARNNTLFVPQVYSLNPETCKQDSTCSPGEKNNVSVGTKNGTLADYNGDGVPDELGIDGSVQSILSTGSYLAVTRFFAFADDNRMPIRQVMVDWQDGTQITNDGREGLYKNRQPVCLGGDATGPQEMNYCATPNGDITGVTCDDKHLCPIGQECVSSERLRGNEPFDDLYDTNRFGVTSRACTEGYFEFVHEYTCDEETLAAGDPTIVRQVATLGDERPRLYAAGLNDEDLVCVYKPRVQVKDNWGWCNGECRTEYENGQFVGEASEGCYSNFDLLLDVPGIQGKDQCLVTPRNEQTIGVDPWTYYNGQVIIIPSE